MKKEKKRSVSSDKSRYIPKKQGRRSSAKKSSNTRSSSLSKAYVQHIVGGLFVEAPSKVYNYKQICYAVGAKTMTEKRLVVSVLEQMSELGMLQEVELGRYRLSVVREQSTLVGKLQVRGRSIYCILDDEQKEPIELSQRGQGRSLHGDRVRLRMVRSKRGGRPIYEVAEVLERNPATYVGRVMVMGSRITFSTEQRELNVDVRIAPADLGGAVSGDKVVLQILGWAPRDAHPRGAVVQVLGQLGDNDAEMHAILAEYGLPWSYPEEVEHAALLLSGEIAPRELERREDFRQVLTMTIDPRDAKDFDDAISIRALSSERWEVGVHIADVSHFVEEGSVIDAEAYRRATSIYLVDRTIPMLPERLCNELCSLRPLEEKYAYSCVFEIDDKGKVHGHRICRSVICSDRRFTYEEAQDIIETGQGDHAEAILQLNHIARQLRKDRLEAGSIDFERAEVRFEIDDKGHPISVYLKESLEAHQLVEEWMLLANKTVAESIAKLKQGRERKAPTFVYRVHDTPDVEKLRQLSDFVRPLGYQLQVEGGAEVVGRSINKLLCDSRGSSAEDLIATVAIRSMAKAKYSTENIGHYGLAFEYYTHFTSPIRRYPDLIVHRLLTHYLVEKGRSVDASEYESKCEHCSAMESLATVAERASIKYKQVEYLSGFLGQEFEGVISGIADWGIYVELEENKCEGLVPMRDLSGDYYEYDQASFALVGRNTGKRYSLGDKLRVQVVQANLERKIVDFALVE